MPLEEQQEIPGTERPKIKAIEKAADNYTDIRDTRMEWTTKEVTAREKLIQVVTENADKIAPNEKGERIYRYGDDLEVVLKPGKPKVKVRHADAEDAE